MIRELVDKNCRAIFKHPLLYLFALVALTGFFSYFYATLPTETSVESLIIEDDPDLQFYEEFKDQFGEDEFLVVGFQHERFFSAEILSIIAEQTRQLEQIEEVKEVVSLTNVENILGTKLDFIVRPLVEELPQNTGESREIEDQAKANPLIQGNLFSSDTNSALFLIRTEPHPGDESYDSRLISKVNKVFANSPREISYHLAGWLVTDVSMSRYMARDMMVFMPITFGIIALFLWVFLRNIYAVAISLLTVTISLVWTMALLNLLGGSMSPMTSILSPLIMALIVADCVHIFRHFLHSQNIARTPVDAIHATLKQLGIPCFLTSITTAIGFASLGLSDIPPIRHLGLSAAGGMIFEFILAITIIPLSIYALRNKSGTWRLRHSRRTFALNSMLNWWSSVVREWSKTIVVLSALLVAFSLYSLTQIQVETNLIDYFKEGTQVRTDTDFFDKNLGGATTLEVSLKTDELDYFKDPEALKMIEEIEQYVTNWFFVTESTNLTSFLKQMNAAFHNNRQEFYTIPDSRNLISQYLLLYDGDELGYFTNRDYNWARLSFRLNEHSTQILGKKIVELNQYLKQNIDNENLRSNITGKTYLVTKLVDSIISSQTKSLALALLIIFACLFWVFKSLSIGLLSILPNLFPIIINFGLMGLFDIPLNTATAIISAIAIGIAVDDTIHYLVHYQQGRKQGLTAENAMIDSIKQKGGAIITTSIILTGGFAVLCFSSFIPTVQFGLLCSLIMISAVLGDLVILPAIISTSSRDHHKKP